MGKFIDLTGQKFNMLTVIKKSDEKSQKGRIYWECRCDCGNTTYVSSNNLKYNGVKSCGCLKHIPHTVIHNGSKTRLYNIWAGMKARCLNPNHVFYKYYGERGISICEEWKNSFETFRDWANSHGYNDSLTIERVNVDKNYDPENCTWITQEEQMKNRKSVRLFTLNGVTKDLTDWCKEFNMDYKLVHNRLCKLKWPFEKAISEPVKTKYWNKSKRKDS